MLVINWLNSATVCNLLTKINKHFGFYTRYLSLLVQRRWNMETIHIMSFELLTQTYHDCVVNSNVLMFIQTVVQMVLSRHRVHALTQCDWVVTRGHFWLIVIVIVICLSVCRSIVLSTIHLSFCLSVCLSVVCAALLHWGVSRIGFIFWPPF